nr:energy transducer TonB [Candidatus Acidoferrales bacterium]
MRRIICAVGCLLIAGAICGARQTAVAANSAPQANISTAEVSSPEMDALATKILEKLNTDKVTSVVVVGGGSREGNVSELAVDIHDGINDALVRQATGLHVASRTETAAELKRLHVSIGMLYTDTLAEWIATNAQANGLVTISAKRIENGHAVTITAEILDKGTKIVHDKKTKPEVSSAKFEEQINLTDAQMQSAMRDYHAPMNTPVRLPEKDGSSMPKCIYCPRPAYSEVGRTSRLNGTMHIVLTVLPDGTADDILIASPIGYGMDAAAVDALLTWKFSPGLDKQGHPAAFQVPVEIRFESYSQ